MRLSRLITFSLSLASLLGAFVLNAQPPTTPADISNALGWVHTEENRCGGYYIEPAITTSNNLLNPETINILSNQLTYSLHGTSESQGEITIRRNLQEIKANRGFLYRNPHTEALNVIDLIGNVNLREPNTLILAENGQFNKENKTIALNNLLYRTAIYGELSTKQSIQWEALQTRNIYQLSAWGEAHSFVQERPKVYVFENASYSTCPPASLPFWRVRASHIELNKETGRGSAHHARLYIHDVPVFYTPYINFPIDQRRQTGFLWPTIGSNSNSGPYVSTPFYWNMAPNYDMTLTPAVMAKRGLEITDLFRYLTIHSSGALRLAVIPYDRAFVNLQQAYGQKFGGYTDSVTQAELRRLLNAGTTRHSIIWNDNTYYNENWSSAVDFKYVSDDFYLVDLGNGISEVTQNQLLQQAQVDYKNKHWSFTGRLQGYQTLHPVDVTTVFQNQYARFPQLLLNGSYPDEPLGFEYTISNELTRFDIRKNPGDDTKFPIGDRLHFQPAISRPFNLPYFYITPRLQLPMTKYELGHIDPQQSNTPSRILPIFDINSGAYFDRSLQLLGNSYTQTLEPQANYTYVPFKNQNNLPIFDTNVNQLTYDQLFTYNRFSSIDRIGDTNQISLGIITRFINQDSGAEKIRAGIGQIYYFRNRLVSLCTPGNCPQSPTDPNLKRNKSPLSGILKYSVNPAWNAEIDSIWDPLANEFTNQTLALHYQPTSNRIINFGYSFVRGGDTLPGENSNKASSNLSQTDVSAAWPLFQQWSVVGRWTQNLNRHNFQNLLTGVQYDACCWAVRMVAGREFIGLNANNTAQYNTEFFLQFALKGLGNFGTGDPTQTLLSNVSGYNTQFGQDY